MSYERGPRFAPAESDDPARRLRRIEDWAGRHDQWATQSVIDARQQAAEVEARVDALEERVMRLFAAVGEHRLKWGIVAWVVGTAAAAAIASLAM
ncbi:MAG: hypothetical protein AB7T63_10585 [Planctomycetota bacterium]